jgi:hypothetical protein
MPAVQSIAQMLAHTRPREADQKGGRKTHHHELQDEQEWAELAKHGECGLVGRRRIVRSRGER